MFNDIDVHFLLESYKEALNSPDPSTQNGAIIVNSDLLVIGRGCNTFPEGVLNTPERLVRPLKYSVIEHAERSAIYDAAKKGHTTNNGTMYCPWYACFDCCRGIIRSGIKRVVGHQRMMDATPAHWKESIAIAFDMFREAGIITDFIDGPLDASEIRFNGNAWKP